MEVSPPPCCSQHRLTQLQWVDAASSLWLYVVLQGVAPSLCVCGRAQTSTAACLCELVCEEKHEEEIGKRGCSRGSMCLSEQGVEIGSGFDGSRQLGSEHNDEFYMEDGNVRTRTNRRALTPAAKPILKPGLPLIPRVCYQVRTMYLHWV